MEITLNYAANGDYLLTIPKETTIESIQSMLNYFEYVALASGSKITDTQITELANDVKKKWLSTNIHRFTELEEFKGLLDE